MAAHARLKNEFTEDEKYHNVMRWLILSFQSLSFCCFFNTIKLWADTDIRNEPPHDKTKNVVVRPAKTQISLASAQSDQSLRCPHEESLGP